MVAGEGAMTTIERRVLDCHVAYVYGYLSLGELLREAESLLTEEDHQKIHDVRMSAQYFAEAIDRRVLRLVLAVLSEDA